jgi:hypothetical protein
MGLHTADCAHETTAALGEITAEVESIALNFPGNLLIIATKRESLVRLDNNSLFSVARFTLLPSHKKY